MRRPRRLTLSSFLTVAALVGLCLLLLSPHPSEAQGLPRISIAVEESSKPEDVAVTLEIIFLLTILTLAPALLIMLTSFTRIVVVLSFLRMAIGTQSIPPTQLIVGLSLFLPLFVMGPTFEKIYDEAIVPYLDEQLDHQEALDLGMAPIRNFMLRNTRQKDLAL
ncbi:MAG: flagellar biosynthetic protein FliP, partial [Gemmatimonadetes bacterium]|nr:flagellar biosynthetic protein FliP [Gemmatimonadota bacterium]